MKNYIHHRVYIWVLFLNILLISPIIIYPLNIGIDIIFDPVYIWNFLCSFFSLGVINFSFKRVFYIHLFLLPFYIVSASSVFLIFVFDSRLTSGYLWVFLSNISNTSDFIKTYYMDIFFIFGPFFILYVFFMKKIYVLMFPFDRKYIFYFSISLLLIFYVGLFIRQSGLYSNKYTAIWDVIEHDNSSPFGIISQSLSTYNLLMRYTSDIEKREKFLFNAVQLPRNDEQEIHILVIGESARADRWSINGYYRETSPFLSKQRNFISFSNVISPFTLTQKSVPLIITRANTNNPELARTEKSIISVFNDVGFKTSWLTTQAFDHFAGIIHFVANDAMSVRYFDRVYDTFLLKELGELISDSKRSGAKLFIVLHTKGSHAEYSNRYPDKFKVFPDSNNLSRKVILNNRYDNTILFTDFFLSSVISKLEKSKVQATLTYVSDHGENLMDDERRLVGHSYGSKYDSPVPLFFWYSDEFLKKNKNKIDIAVNNKNRKLTTANVFHSIADIANINFDSFDKSMSIFSDTIKEPVRLIYELSDDKFIEYDK